MKTALVLSAGGMFGAYQAGAWKVLSQTMRPDIVVGTSIGAMNGWAIAGGCSPDRLAELWLGLDRLSTYRWRFPLGLRHGLLDSVPVEGLIRHVHGEFKPQVEFGAVVTRTRQLMPVLFQGPDLTWQHLAASTAMLGLFSQQRIEGCLYSDGGLQSALPIWAAVAMGAERVIAINVLPEFPAVAIRAAVSVIRKLAPFRSPVPDTVEVIRLTAPQGMGSARDALYWNRENIARWIAAGEQDAAALSLNTHQVTG